MEERGDTTTKRGVVEVVNGERVDSGEGGKLFSLGGNYGAKYD